MSFKKELMYAGLCLAVITSAAGVQSAFSATGSVAVPVTVLSPDPDIIVTGLTWSTGTFLAINSKTTTATATVNDAGAVTTSPGTPGNARLVGADTTGSALRVQVGSVSPGLFNGTMNLKIADNTTGLATVNLVDATPGDAPFAINAWQVDLTPALGTVNTFVPATGLGTVTLDGTGQLDVSFGATLSTVKDATPKPYGNAAYTGTVKVTLSY